VWEPGDARGLPPADVVVAAPQPPAVTAALRRSGARLVFDLYDPHALEALEGLGGAARLQRLARTTLALDHTLDALDAGHHFLCATERQRDLWIGTLLGARLLGPALYARDPTLRATIDVVPFGVAGEPPRPGPGPRERFGLEPDDEIVLWNGGIWNWLDPQAAVEAVAALAERRPRARLVFMGRPPLEEQAARTAAETRALAERLGLAGSVVHFNDTWVPYDERGGWLLQGACAVSTHVDHLETRYAFRTRVLDCLWAGLPVVCTRGDELAERVEADDLGAAVDPGDADGLTAALERVLERGREAYAPALAAAAEDFRWDRVAAPLVRYATAPALPPRLGDGLARRLARPGHRARALATRALRAVSR
jgi:glycosyltransferase involved in cell wall biosynthesis